jgi:hypothetical protein
MHAASEASSALVKGHVIRTVLEAHFKCTNLESAMLNYSIVTHRDILQFGHFLVLFGDEDSNYNLFYVLKQKKLLKLDLMIGPIWANRRRLGVMLNSLACRGGCNKLQPYFLTRAA